ncbi:MAG: rod shape-determining protein RodA [Bacteroidota bacterium]|jgi:rod shape determining protein RodA
MRQQQSIIGNLDWPLFITFILMIFMGLATVYSVSFNEEHPFLFDLSQTYGKQVLWIGVSLFLGLMVFLIDSDVYRKFCVPIYLFTIGLLVIVLFMPPVHGARAWLGIGSMGIQPAEFAKIGTALLLARFISDLNVKQQNTSSVFIASLIILVPMVLILLQPDAGTFVVFTSFLFVLYREGISFDPFVLRLTNSIPGVKFKETWVGSHFIPILFVLVFLSIATLLISNESFRFGWLLDAEIPGMYALLLALILLGIVLFLFFRWASSKREHKRITVILIIGLITSAAIIFIVNYGFQGLASHQKQRIELFLGLKEDPDFADYNRNRAMAAVGSGGLTGKGYKNASVSSVESNHVPESETDFIFCPFAEEWGFLGTLLLIALYLFMLLRILIIAERQRARFNRVYAYAVAMIMFYHFAVNIGMNIGFAPVIGIPLPFFSYGGSSMLSFSVMMFVLLKLDSQRRDVLQ